MKISKKLILKHRDFSKCPHVERELADSWYIYGTFPCPCRTFEIKEE